MSNKKCFPTFLRIITIAQNETFSFKHCVRINMVLLHRHWRAFTHQADPCVEKREGWEPCAPALPFVILSLIVDRLWNARYLRRKGEIWGTFHRVLQPVLGLLKWARPKTTTTLKYTHGAIKNQKLENNFRGPFWDIWKKAFLSLNNEKNL